MLPQLTKKEFDIFLMIHASHVDYNYTEDERKFILKMTTDQESYERMIELFNATSDYNSLKIIQEHKIKYYSNSEKREELYKKVKDLFKVDGDYSRGEKLFLEFIDRMIIPQQ